MDRSTELRERISGDYGRAVTRTSARSCCGDLACATAEDIGYTAEELAALPEGVADSSFGCGNPLAFSEVRQGDVVVDLGSGAGLDLLIAARKAGAAGRAIGIDMTDEMIEKARASIAAVGAANAEVRKGVIEDLPVESDSVDWVISNCVINLSTDKPRVFAEIARILKPGGRVRVSDIVLEEGAMPAWVAENSAFHDQLYSACIAGAISEADYLGGLRAAGLGDIEVSARTVYSAAQIAGFMDQGEVLVNTPATVNGSAAGAADVERLVAALVGKVWSAQVRARKPA